ncbi:MAG: TetR/AcrR family transcriptional regulator [Chloroflexota bacterium]
MGRKSLAAERTEEILDAFERCILKYGLEGTSLEQVAEEAGVKRSIIRHYIGNREQVVTALIDRLMSDYEQGLTDLFTSRPQSERVSTLLDALFGEQDDDDERTSRILAEILAAGQERYPEPLARFVTIYEAMIQQIAQALGELYPNAAAEQCHEVAFAVFALSNATEDLGWAGLDLSYTQMAHNAAKRLIDQLAGSAQ